MTSSLEVSFQNLMEITPRTNMMTAEGIRDAVGESVNNAM